MLLDKLMYDNNNGKNNVMVKDTGDDDTQYKVLKSSEGLRQLGDLLQSKHEEMTSIFNMIFV